MSASVFAGRCASPGEKDANTMRVYDDTRLSALISGEDDDAFGAADSPNPRNKKKARSSDPDAQYAMDSESDSEDEPSPYDSPMAEEPDPAGSISAASAGGEGEAERDAASPAAEEEEEREDHDAAVSEPDSEADSLRAREDAEAAEWLGTPTKKEELWAAEKKEREAKYAQMEDDILKAFQRKKMERAVRAHERFESMLDDVMSGIDGVKKDAETPSGILHEMDDMVDKRRAAYERKRKEIHDEWQSDVFDRIQRQVKAHVDAIDPEELSDRLRAYHDEYYERDREKQEYNHRSGLFLDECLAYDYDAFEKNRAHAFQYTIDSLRDPTKRDVHKFVKEKLAAGLIKREAALAGTTPKYMLESKHWNNLKYTMHGRYVDEDGNALAPDAAIPGYFRQCDTETGEKMWNRHTADLTQYDAPTGNEFANAEWERWRGTQHVQMDYGPRGKLSLKGESSWKDYRGGERMRELVEQRRPPGVTGGDYELEKKPHKTSMREGVSGLEGRGNLFGVTQMHSLPPRERASDQRLDSKGDAWRRYGAGSGLRAPIPPPCEVRRNFDSLQEYISEQQPTFFKRSHPSELFGDRWLDLKGKDPVHGRRQSTYADQNGMYKMLTHSHEYDLRETRPTGPTREQKAWEAGGPAAGGSGSQRRSFISGGGGGLMKRDKGRGFEYERSQH